MSIVTIKDVAARAGVSPKTVSRVINGEAHVRPELRDLVQRIVAELDYRPNAFARSLSSSRSYLLGLFIDDPVSGYAADVQHGALMGCRARSYHLVVEPVDLAAPDWALEVRASIAALRLDGAIVAPPICDDAALMAIFAEAGLPTVLVAPSKAPAGSGTVRMDDRGAAREVTEYLLGLGHRRIGFVQGPLSHSASARREEGFRAAMAAAGVDIDEASVVRGDFTSRSGLALGERLLALKDRPTAIFASNDDMALGVLITAMKHGIAVPETLSLCGFDDAPSSRAAWPQLTTVRQPKAEMAAAAVDILVDPQFRRTAGGEGSHLMLPHELIVRGSTGPA
ncbi:MULTISPECIES: LacI family DNA-binding transcriptional regulator [unclassified Novosphingobium]|uniref:LacI family DNA-binding transcriptional regulator n=1 Tax=unclassified Novosphingobium TaxID=2644732 RepID=UPI0012C17D84|nr:MULTISPECIES: LacI family DNA-binding transcriptional regulator [unclassified Novosphingobium]MPS70193.1 LacI family DNA-binding transcriptional regulator [Novosphingobium sp.]WRT94832.1 LacI family DNA-binding transcriptional regulator [Novosphingobium sp. RL4]